MDYIGFVYIWFNKKNRKKYIGSHVGKLYDGYIGSGKYFKRAVEKYGIENFERQILWFESVSQENLHKKEFDIINEHNAVKDKDYYNQVNITPSQTYYIDGKFQYSDNFTSKGKKYYNNGSEEKRFIPNSQPEGWNKGRLKGINFGQKNGFYNKKHTPETIEKIKKSIRRRKCESLEKQL